MTAFLDDKPLTLDRPTLARALAAARTAAGANGRVVVEATAGGKPIDDAVLQNPPDSPFHDDIRFISVDPGLLVRSTLLDAADALDRAKVSQRECAELIQSGDLDRSLQPLGAAIETWRAVRDAVEKSSAMMGERLTGADAAAPLETLVTELAARLEDIRRALKDQDWSSLSDVLAYDLTEQVDRWQQKLRAMADHLRPTAR